MRARPHIVWRYVFKEILSPVLLGLMVYVLVFLMNALFELAELAIKKDIPVGVVARLLLFLMPRVLEMTLPMSILLGILIGVGRLSADSEIIALRASGVSYRRILMPILFIALGGWLASSYLILRVEPWAKYTQRRLLSEQIYSADLRREIKPRVFFEQIPGLILYADEVHQEGDFLDRVFLAHTDAEGREVVTLGRRAQIDYDRGSGRTQFLLESGTSHTLNPAEPDSYQISRFERQKFIQEPDQTFKMKADMLSKPSPRNYGEQSLEELDRSARQAASIDHVKTRNRVVGSIMVAWHERFALPFACLAFAFIGVPLGIANRRGGKASGFSLSIGIAIAYWVIYSFGQNLVREGKLEPLIGMWAANVLLTVLGALLLTMRERTEGLDPRALVPRFIRQIRRRVRERRAQPKGPVAVGAPTIDEREDEEDEPLNPDLVARRRHPVIAGIMLIVLGGLASLHYTSLMTAGLVLLGLIFLFSTTLDRHVIERFLGVLAGCVLSFFTLVMVYQFIQIFQDLIEHSLPMHLAFRYLGYRIPWALSQVLPMSCLVACLLTFGVMSKFNEVIAAKAGGTSVYRLAIPVVMVTFCLSVLGYVNYDYLMPYTEQRAQQIKDAIRGRAPRSYQPGDRRWVFGEGGHLYNFRNYISPPVPVLPAAGAGTFEGFSIYELDPSTFEMRSRTYAKSAAWESGHWVLRDGWTRTFASDGEKFERFPTRVATLRENPTWFVKEWKTPEQMNFSELRRLVASLKARGYATQEMEVDLYSKTSYPLVPLTLVIIALPFCFSMGRRGSLYGVGVAILLAATYFLAFSATSALGSASVMPAFLAAWAPNILFSGAGAYLLLKAET
ncbi:MAG TPA: LPS export ABC transporter permease LptF [Candidatus Polarisedimenticolia bacterium]|nr:LPS export ABC transporter permease LptF [Candidatus Polarisedimenticolia bacterium]